MQVDTLVARGTSFSPVFGRWPSIAEMSRDLELPEATVRSWIKRDSIPERHWFDLEAAAQRRGIIGITYMGLAQIKHDMRRRRR